MRISKTMTAAAAFACGLAALVAAPSTVGANTVSARASDMYMPVAAPPGTQWNVSDGLGAYPGHLGMDFTVPVGTPVHAMAGGVITDAKELRGYEPRLPAGQQNGFYSYGRYVSIKHDGGSSSLYAHLSAVGVKAGQTVQPGQQIGLSGAAGNTLGPVLHFEVRVDGVVQEPLVYLAGKGAQEPTGGSVKVPGCAGLRAPKGTLRNGAEKIGLEHLCNLSVLEARTPEAARAILYALGKLGTPYSTNARNKPGTFDSTYLVAKAYESAGVTKFFSKYPSTVAYADAKNWRGVLAKSDGYKPGDIRIMWRPGKKMSTSAGANGHAQLHLADGFVVQSGGRGGDARVNVSSDADWGWNTANFRRTVSQ